MSLLECCLGDSEGPADIHVAGNLRSGEGTGNANVLPTGSTYVCERIPVALTTLDALFAAGRLPPDCALIKIDAEGYELNILRGARTFLAASRPIIFGEFMRHCLAWHGQTQADVVRFIGDFDYRAYRKLAGKTPRFVPYDPADKFEQDMLLVPRESVSRLAWCLEERTRVGD